MTNEKESLLYQTHQSGRSKYVYFILAAAGAAIAFAITHTLDKNFTILEFIWLLAISFWSASFFCGARSIEYSNAITFNNMDLLAISSGTHPMTGNDPVKATIAYKELKAILDRDSNRAGRYSRAQIWLFWAGGLVYVAWHVSRMLLLN